MASTPYDTNRLEQFAAEGTSGRSLQAIVQGGIDRDLETPLFSRMVVLEVLFDPSGIDDNTQEYYAHTLGIANSHLIKTAPRNSILAQKIRAGGAFASDSPVLLYPFFPSHLSLPCKVGEHVWVVFENPQQISSVGYWMCRIPTPHFVDDVNHTHAPREFEGSFGEAGISKKKKPAYEFRNGVSMKAPDGKTTLTDAETSFLPGGDEKAYEKLLTNTNASTLTSYEPIPRYRKRPADQAFEGSNNTLIVMGTDRTGPAAKFKDDKEKGKLAGVVDADQRGGAGAIDIVVGRGQTEKTSGKKAKNSLNNDELAKAPADVQPNEGDPDFVTDRSRIYTAQRTLVDKNFALDDYNNDTFKVEDASKGNGAIVAKSDKIRIIAREDVEIIVIGSEKDANGLPKDNADAKKFTSIMFDGKTGAVSVDSSNKVNVKAADNVTVDTKKDVIANAEGNVSITSKKDVSVTATGTCTVEAKTILLGKNATQTANPLIESTQFLADLQKFFTDLLTALNVFAAAGSVGSPVKHDFTGTPKLVGDLAALQKFVATVGTSTYKSKKVFNE